MMKSSRVKDARIENVSLFGQILGKGVRLWSFQRSLEYKGLYFMSDFFFILPRYLHYDNSSRGNANIDSMVGIARKQFYKNHLTIPRQVFTKKKNGKRKRLLIGSLNCKEIQIITDFLSFFQQTDSHFKRSHWMFIRQVPITALAKHLFHLLCGKKLFHFLYLYTLILFMLTF